MPSASEICWIDAAVHTDETGRLLAVEFSRIPFTVVRAFTVSGKAGATRGGHGHLYCLQALFCVRGKVDLSTLDVDGHRQFTLNADGRGLLLPQRTWSSQHYTSDDSVLLVLASRPYEPDDYFDSPDFLERTG